jgi:hypothetical protein
MITFCPTCGVPSVSGMRTLTGSPVDRLLTLSQALSLGLTLVSSVLYVLRGWDDGPAALLHVLGGTVGALVVVRLVTYLESWQAAAVLLIGMLGCAGVVGYGFNTMEVGLGGVNLIDAAGMAVVLKPLGLCWPLALLVAGIALWRRVPRWCAVGIVLGSVAFPVARIANIGWLAVLTDLVLLSCLVAVPSVLRRTEVGPGDPVRVG